MKSFSLLSVFAFGITASALPSPYSTIPPQRDALQTANVLQTAAADREKHAPTTHASAPTTTQGQHHVPTLRIPPFIYRPPIQCCPPDPGPLDAYCTFCTPSNVAPSTLAAKVTLPWFNNFTVPAPTGHLTRANHTTEAPVIITSTVISPIVTSTDESPFPNRCMFWEGYMTGGRKCPTGRDDTPLQTSSQTDKEPSTTLATTPTVPDPSGLPPFLTHFHDPHVHKYSPPCTTTLYQARGLDLGPKTAYAATVTSTSHVDCGRCALEIKTMHRANHGPAVPGGFRTVTRGGTATETVTECYGFIL